MDKKEYYRFRRIIRTAIYNTQSYDKDAIFGLLYQLLSVEIVKRIDKYFNLIMETLGRIDGYMSELPCFWLLFKKIPKGNRRLELQELVVSLKYQFRCPNSAKRFLQHITK